MSQPASTSHAEIATTHETSADSFHGPGAVLPGEEETAEQALSRLEAFLDQTFPAERDRSNHQVPEGDVDMAIRLLTGLAAFKASHEPNVRCKEPYCNKPLGHLDAHGTVHFQS